MVLVTLAESWLDSGRVARHEGTTVLAGDDKSCPALPREGLSLSGIDHGAADNSWFIFGNQTCFLQRGATRRRENCVSLTHLIT